MCRCTDWRVKGKFFSEGEGEILKGVSSKPSGKMIVAPNLCF
jgi:hypothetical protein